MKTPYYTFLLCIMIAFGSCKPDEEPTDLPPELTTLAAENITGTTVTLGGDVTSQGSYDVQTRGVCWSKNANPTFSDNCERADGSGLGKFTVDIKDLEPNTTYHVRAFADNAITSSYGNNITFTTGSPLGFTTEIARRIISSRATLRGAVVDASVTVGSKGFVMGTSPNPTVNDIKLSDGVGEGPIEIFLINLTPNTTYYARPYAYALGENLYGEEISFKTCGYFGPAGGFVFYDKGEETDGWRYFEASPQIQPDSRWGCDGTFVSNTFPEEGTGLENTNSIVFGCTAADCAARDCFNHQYNGFTDWFLPSREETVTLMRSLDDLSSTTPKSLWTSTETSATEAYHVYWNGNNLIESAISKTSQVESIPIRRY